MAKLSTAEIIDAIKELSVLELNDLVKACERSSVYQQQQVLL
jgi:large subunit ribosomal protein L7/L12